MIHAGKRLFHQICTEKGIVYDNRQIFEYLNTFEEKNNYVQLSLFDEIVLRIYSGEPPYISIRLYFPQNYSDG